MAYPYSAIEENYEPSAGQFCGVADYPSYGDRGYRISEYDSNYTNHQTEIAQLGPGALVTVDAFEPLVIGRLETLMGCLAFTLTEPNTYRTFDASTHYVTFTIVVPVAPTGVSATDGTYEDKITISWNAVAGAQTYNIWRATSEQGSATLLVDSLTGTSYDDETAEVGNTYWYYVVGVNSAGAGAESTRDAGWLYEELPDAPANVAATDGTYTDKIQITW